MCDDVLSCIHDYAVTGSIQLGLTTLEVVKENNMLEKVLGMLHN